MQRKTLVITSVLLVLGLLLGVFGCTQAVITPSPTPSPSPTLTPTATPSPKPSPTPSPSPAQPQVIKWKGQNAYFTYAPPVAGFPLEGGMGMHGKEWAKWVKEITNGRLEIELAPSGAIVPDKDGLTAVGQGSLDVAAVGYAGFHTGIIPEGNYEIGIWPWITTEDMFDFLFLRGGDDILREAYLEQNVMHFSFPCAAKYAIHSMVPINRVSDLKGLKVRAAGLNADVFAALGAKPTVIAAAEGYMALKLGTVDAAHWGQSVLDEIKLKEVEKYNVTKPMGIGGIFPVMVNLDKWKALPDDIKKLIADNTKYRAFFTVTYEEQYAIYTLARAIKEYGIKAIEWPDEDAQLIYKTTMELLRKKLYGVSARCNKSVEIIEQQMRDLGRMK